MKVGVNNLTENILTKEKFFLTTYGKVNAHKLVLASNGSTQTGDCFLTYGPKPEYRKCAHNFFSTQKTLSNMAFYVNCTI